jgi:hypothetical protein
MNTDIKKEMINTQARLRYKLLSQEGRNKKLIPKEDQKKRGRKPKTKPEQTPEQTANKTEQTTEQLNKQYNIIKKLVGVADNKYIIEKLKQLNRQNEYIKKEHPTPEPEPEPEIKKIHPIKYLYPAPEPAPIEPPEIKRIHIIKFNY